MRPALDWHAAGLFPTVDPDWRRKLRQGGALLLLPLVGWPLALGYRCAVLRSVVHGGSPILPEWRGQLRALLAEGVAATAVIHLHFLPLYAWLASLYGRAGVELPWGAAAVLFAVLPMLSPLALPLGIGFLRYQAGPLAPGAELAALSLAYAAVTFYIPAGFLRVSRSGRMRSAFAVIANVRLIARAFPRYVEAWVGSCLLSLIGHAAFPVGVVWCYLAIVYAFNEVPLALPEARDGYLQRSWFAHFRDAHWRPYRRGRRGWVTTYERGADPAELGDGAGEERFRAVALGPLRVPLPG